MSKTCNVCGKEHNTNGRQCSPECRRIHAARCTGLPLFDLEKFQSLPYTEQWQENMHWIQHVYLNGVSEKCKCNKNRR